MTTPTIDHIDESVGRLLAAIELAQFELEQGRYIEAKITLAMALEEHKARLAQLSKLTGASDKRWMSNAYNGIVFVDLTLPSLAHLWEDEQD